jgi:hypothetical protein
MRLAFCILLVLPILRFALAAPVPVGVMVEVRSNVVGVRKDDMAAWKKRMDDEDEEEEEIDYDEGDESKGVTEEELESDTNNDQKDDSDDDKKSEDGDAKSGSDDDDSGGGGGGHADDNENDNEHNGSGYDSSFTSLGAESTRPAVPESTDVEKIVGALSKILTPGSGFRPAAG